MTQTSAFSIDFKERLEVAKNHLIKEIEIIKIIWPVFLVCLFQNFVHSVAHNVAYYLHTPRRTLYDLSFAALPALDSKLQSMSEYLFFIIIAALLLFALSPFVTDNNTLKSTYVQASSGTGNARNDRLIIRKNGLYVWDKRNQSTPPLYTIHIATRFLSTMAFATVLRSICFLITGLPGPNYHCRPFSPFYNPPLSLLQLLFRSDVFFSCGDLVFSSHTTFIILSGLSYIKYGTNRIMKVVCWFIIGLFAFLVLCARKHYSIDIFMALYVVPLIWVANDALFPDTYSQKMVDADIPLPVSSEEELQAENQTYLVVNDSTGSHLSSRRNSFLDSIQIDDDIPLEDLSSKNPIHPTKQNINQNSTIDYQGSPSSTTNQPNKPSIQKIEGLDHHDILYDDLDIEFDGLDVNLDDIDGELLD